MMSYDTILRLTIVKTTATPICNSKLRHATDCSMLLSDSLHCQKSMQAGFLVGPIMSVHNNILHDPRARIYFFHSKNKLSSSP